jgi:hypothetical protein
VAAVIGRLTDKEGNMLAHEAQRRMQNNPLISQLAKEPHVISQDRIDVVSARVSDQ